MGGFEDEYWRQQRRLDRLERMKAATHEGSRTPQEPMEIWLRRRREQIDDPGNPEPSPGYMRVVCTDKDSHRELQLDEFVNGRMVGSPFDPDAPGYWKPFGHWVRRSVALRASNGNYVVAEPPRLSETQRFHCRKCGRNTQLSASRLPALLDGLRDAGVFVLDISYLPY